MLLVQKWPFFQLFFLGSVGQENLLYDLLEPKVTFLGYKKKSSKSQKIEIFQNGLTHAFGPKMAIFLTFFFLHYRPGKCLYDILEPNNTFLGYKTKSSKT